MTFFLGNKKTFTSSADSSVRRWPYRFVMMLSLLSFISLSIVVPVLDQDLKVLTEVIESDSDEKESKTPQFEKEDVKTFQSSAADSYFNLSRDELHLVQGEDMHSSAESEPGTPPPEHQA